MDQDPTTTEIIVRPSGPDDVHYASAAEALIEHASHEHDIARRELEFLEKKISTGRAAVALRAGELVGFGYYSEWEGGKFVSHSGLVVRDDLQGHGLGRKLKMALFEASRERFPDAILMSLTTSPQVRAMNLKLGFHVVPIEELTDDPEFWKGCQACRNYEATKKAGKRCCCEAMILRPGEGPQ